MSNEIEKIGEAVLHGIEAPIKYIVKAEKVLATAIKDQPELKSVIIDVVTKAEGLAADVAAAVGARGLNWIADEKLVADVQAFFTKQILGELVPVVEKVYGEVKTDLAA